MDELFPSHSYYPADYFLEYAVDSTFYFRNDGMHDLYVNLINKRTDEVDSFKVVMHFHWNNQGRLETEKWLRFEKQNNQWETGSVDTFIYENGKVLKSLSRTSRSGSSDYSLFIRYNKSGLVSNDSTWFHDGNIYWYADYIYNDKKQLVLEHKHGDFDSLKTGAIFFEYNVDGKLVHRYFENRYSERKWEDTLEYGFTDSSGKFLKTSHYFRTAGSDWAFVDEMITETLTGNIIGKKSAIGVYENNALWNNVTFSYFNNGKMKTRLANDSIHKLIQRTDFFYGDGVVADSIVVTEIKGRKKTHVVFSRELIYRDAKSGLVLSEDLTIFPEARGNKNTSLAKIISKYDWK